MTLITMIMEATTTVEIQERWGLAPPWSSTRRLRRERECGVTQVLGMSGNTVISGIALGVIKVRDNIIYMWFFLVSMLPQYMALSVSFVSFDSLFVKKNLCVRLLEVPPPCENTCVRLLGYIVGASPLVCVLSLVDNLRWILACCQLRFATFLKLRMKKCSQFSCS